MALTVATNTGALTAQAAASSVNKEMETAMNRLATGQRINSAADDAAGVAISSRMTAQINGLNQAIRNAGDGQSMASTAEGAMQEIESMLQRMRELAVQAQNGTLSANDRSNLNDEVTQLKAEIDRISGSTEFNGVKLLDGTADVSLQIGAGTGNSLNFKIGSMATTALGTSLTTNASTATTSAKASGTQASENITQLTFNGNDTYGFKIVLDGKTEALAGAADKEIDISAAMTNSDATAIADAINTAVAANTTGGADISAILTATASGNVVTLTAKDGKSVDISAFTSAASGSMTVNQVTNSSAASVVLEDVTEQKGLSNTNNTPATAASSTLQLDEDKKFQFRVNGTLVSVTGASGDGAATATAIKNAIEAQSGVGNATVTFTDRGSFHSYEMSDSTGKQIAISGFQKITSSAVPNGYMTIDVDTSSSSPVNIDSGEYTSSTPAASGGTALGVATGKTGTISFSNQDLSYSFSFVADGTNTVVYTVDGKTKDFQAELTRVANEITAAGGTGLAAINNGGVLEITNTTGSTVSFADAAISAPGEAAVTAGNGYYLEGAYADAVNTGDGLVGETGTVTLVNGSIVTSTNGVQATKSQMSLDIQGDDRYTFVIDKDNDTGTDATITADVLNGDLSGLVNAINAHSTTTGIKAAVENAQVVLTKDAGTAFAIHSFSAENNGKIIAANALGQGGAKTLENDGDGAAVNIAASGPATSAEMKLAFSAVDKYSFQITDGSSTAIVRATDTTDAGADGINAAADTADIATEITSALNAANMSNITVTANADGTITLKNILGGSLDINNFRSDGTGTVTATPASGQGVGTIMNDDSLSASQAAISSVSINTSANASLAVAAVDRALETLGQERANLGAVVNRLDYTISNLTNVSAETSAARGRIQDADFASETSTLAKSQILQQASMAMLAQANAAKQNVLSLLQG
jgi:flagellin